MSARRPSYGWAVVAALSVTETTSWGIVYYGFGEFLKPMEADLGWSRVQLTGAFSVALACQGAAGVAVGRWLDRPARRSDGPGRRGGRGSDPRVLMTAGSVAATLLVVAWSRVRSLPAFYAVWALLGVVMATVLYEPAFTVITKWFPGAGRRGALTALTMVAGLASTIFLPLENRLILALGWRGALAILAVVLGVVTIPLHLLVLRPAPGPIDRSALEIGPVGGGTGGAGASAAPQPSHTRAVAVRLPAFRYLAAAFVAASFVSSALATHQVAYLQERGYSATFAAAATGALGAMQLPGRALFAPLLHWLPRPAVTTAVFATFAVGLIVLAAGTGTASVWVFVVVYGMGRGMSTLLRATLVGDLFGARHYGSITGLLASCTTIALAVAPVLAGLLYDRLGGYGAVIWTLVAVAALSVAAATMVERRPVAPVAVDAAG